MKKSDEQLYALIYNRVSSIQQEKEGSGLESQEHRCIKYAKSKGYMVDTHNIFHDTFSGGGDFMRRPAMRELLEYIDNNPKKNYVVVFDDLKRFARDTKFHIELRSAFNIRKVKVECLNFNFEDTPEGNFVETILAAQNQLEREQNQRQVIQKQKARLEAGYWAFHAPIGYSMMKDSKFSGKIAVPNNKSHFLKEAIEGYANLKFNYLTDVARFLKQKGILGKCHSEKYIDTVKAIIKNPFYAGYIEYTPWGVSKRKGIHKAIISEAIYYRNKIRLESPLHASQCRKVDNPEFELRRLVTCTYCKRAFTGAFSKGRSSMYPYYLCRTRGCTMHRKSISREILHQDFKSALEELQPASRVIIAFRQLFAECWKSASTSFLLNNKAVADEVKQFEVEIQKYLDLICAVNSPAVRIRYEEKVEGIEKEIALLKERKLFPINLSIPCQTALEKIISMAENPYKSWSLLSLEGKKEMYYFFFEENIQYDLKTRYQTVKPTVLYRFFRDFSKNSADVDIPQKFSNQFNDIWHFIQKWNIKVSS